MIIGWGDIMDPKYIQRFHEINEPGCPVGCVWRIHFSRSPPVWNPAWKTDSRLLVYLCSFFGAANDRSFSFVSSNRYFMEVCQTYPTMTIITSPTEIKTYYDMLQLLKPESNLSPGSWFSGSGKWKPSPLMAAWLQVHNGGQDRVGLGWSLNKYNYNLI